MDYEEKEIISADEIIEEEERLFEMVRITMHRLLSSHGGRNYEEQLIELRDAMAEEKLEDDRASLMEQMDRIHALSRAHTQAEEDGYVDPSNPYFAHLRYEDESDRRRDILLGKGTLIDGGVHIVDWRNAPISRVFYHWQEGDQFDEPIAGRMRSGMITARRATTIIDGRLLRIACPQGTFVKTADDWQDVSDEILTLSGGAGSAERPDTTRPILGGNGSFIDLRGDKHLQEVSALLDGEQFDLIARPGSGLVVVRGSAGSGKTTVGLHRIAYLNYNDEQRYRPKHMLIVVFNRALARYISKVLPALGVKNVPVRTLLDWASVMKRKHFPHLTRLYAENPPASVVRFKTHRMMISLLEEAAGKNRGLSPEQLFDELFTSLDWMDSAVARYAPGEFTESETQRIHRWCTDQHFYRADGGGPNSDDKPCYDEEDDMILLCLYQRLRGPLRHSFKRKVAYDHLMVDEAQDFSPLELYVLMETVRGNSVTLAGDLAQKIMEHNDFSDWSEVLSAIRQDHIEIDTLKVSYRSTREIVAFANEVLGPLAPDEPLYASREGSPVELFRCGGLGEASTFLAAILDDLMLREPNAGVALLTRFDHQADAVYDALKCSNLQRLSRVRDQDFSFGPGIEVTDISQTKGLEFDYVIVLNVDRETFPYNDMARHILHVAATRAIHQLWLISWAPLSPLLSDKMNCRIAG